MSNLVRHSGHGSGCGCNTCKIDNCDLSKQVRCLKRQVDRIKHADYIITDQMIGTTGYTITNPGSYLLDLSPGFQFNPVDPATFNPVSFIGGGASVSATGFAAVSAGVVRGVFLTNRGVGYTSSPIVVFGGAGSGATGTAVIGTGSGNNAPVGTIAFVTMTGGGGGYRDTVQAAITIKSSNVFLELDNQLLTQFVPANPSAQIPFVVGILIPDPLPDPTSPTQPNVVIPNGNINAIGLESVYISGDAAVISNFSMYGVRIFAHTSDIDIENVTIKDCCGLASKKYGRPTASGLVYLPHDYQPKFPPPVGSPTPSAFGPSFGVAGLAIGESAVYGQGPLFFTDVPLNQFNVTNRIQTVRLNNVNAKSNFYWGGSIICVTDLTVEESHFDFTYSDDPGTNVIPLYNALLAYGMNFSNASQGLLNANADPCNLDFTMFNCTFNNSSLVGDYQTPLASGSSPFTVLGMFGTRNRNGVFTNCQFDNPSNTFADLTNGTTVACYASGGDEDIVFDGCHFDNAFNLGAINGWHTSGNTSNEPTKSGRNIKVINCTSDNHQSRIDLILPAPFLSSQQTVGFAALYGKGFYYEDCQSRNVFSGGPALPNTRSVIGFSIGVTTQPQAQITDFVYKNCTTSRIQAANGGAVIGFNNNNPTVGETDNSLLWENSRAMGNQALIASISPTWLITITYAVGAFVSLTVSGVVNNFVSLANSNLANSPVPGSATAFWSPINTAPAAWNVTTNYALGSLVSYAVDTFGHVNEYVSIVANNLGNYPNAPGIIGTNGGLSWVQTNVYPTWSSSATYISNMIVGLNGVSYLSSVSSNINNPPATSPSQWTSTTGVGQGYCIGFFSNNELTTATATSGPEIYKNCLASFNVGAQGPIGAAGSAARYTCGFFSIVAQDSLYDSCIAEQNTGSGFLFKGSQYCAIRKCQADNNTNEGFTDLGSSLTATPSAVSITTNQFEGNQAFNNGASTLVISLAPNTASPTTITVIGTAPPNGSSVIISGAQGNTAINGTFVVSASTGATFQIAVAGNGAYVANSATVIVPSQIFFGPNSNYNIQVRTGGTYATQTPPLLDIQNSSSTYAPINPGVYFSGLHNFSTIV